MALGRVARQPCHFLAHAAAPHWVVSLCSQNRTKHRGARCWGHTPRFLSHLVLNPPSAAREGVVRAQEVFPQGSGTPAWALVVATAREDHAVARAPAGGAARPAGAGIPLRVLCAEITGE